MSALGTALWNPIVAKEVRSRMRTWRAPMVLIAFLTVLGAVGYTAYQSTAPGVTSSADMGRVGTSVFGALSGTIIVLVGLIVPGLVGGAISGERERQTLDLLMVTPVRPWRIVLGKLFSSLLFVLYLVVGSIPLFSIVFVLGGVELYQVVAVMVVTLVTAVVLGALAMLCSAAMRRTTASTVSSYIAAFLLTVAPLIAGALIASAQSTYGVTTGRVSIGPNGMGSVPVVTGTSGNPPPPVIYASPAAAMYGVLGGTTTFRSVPACPTFITSHGAYGGSCQTASMLRADQIPGGLFGGWTYWEAFTVVDSVIAVLALGGSVLVLRGRLPRGLRPSAMATD